jgi:hypothetical protein
VNGAVLTVANDIMKARQFSITHGGILDTRDVVGIRKGKIAVHFLPYRL